MFEADLAVHAPRCVSLFHAQGDNTIMLRTRNGDGVVHGPCGASPAPEAETLSTKEGVDARALKDFDRCIERAGVDNCLDAFGNGWKQNKGKSVM